MENPLIQQVKQHLDSTLVPALKKFIEIPNLSRNFDTEWETNGLMEQAVDLCIDYANQLGIEGLNLEKSKDEGKTLFLFGDVAAKSPDAKTILFYGHIDKQPHLTEDWSEGLHPTKAITRGNLLFGRGSHDDGYAFFLATSLVKLLQDAGTDHRYIFFFETDEESESKDLFHYMEKYRARIGDPNIVIALDSGAPSTELFSFTSSLRGAITLQLDVQTMPQSVHSGMNSGFVPGTIRIVRQLLDRIEDTYTGVMTDDLQVDIPADKYAQAQLLVNKIDQLGIQGTKKLDGVKYISDSSFQGYLNSTWRPTLVVTGQEGLPDMKGGNVLRKSQTLKLSIRIPPMIDAHEAENYVIKTLESNPPYGAKVSCTSMEEPGPGWNAPEYPQEFMTILNESSTTVFGEPAYGVAIGGSIPFVELLSDKLPKSLFMVTGVALPDSNAHGPDESIDLTYLEKFSQTMALFLSKY